MDILDRLNRSQTEAVTATEGYIRVIAGAGSGKTRALSHRFAFLVNEIGILPGNILCVIIYVCSCVHSIYTFTGL